MAPVHSRGGYRRESASSSTMASPQDSEDRRGSSSTVSNTSDGQQSAPMAAGYIPHREGENASIDKQSPPGGTYSANGEDGIRRGLRVTSRVHRACTACRRQKMRCEGPVNGPCNRCQTSHQECVFEKPPRDGGNNGLGEAGNARISAVEARLEGFISIVADWMNRPETDVHSRHSVRPWLPPPGTKSPIHPVITSNGQISPKGVREPRARSDITIDALTSPRRDVREPPVAYRHHEVASDSRGHNAPPEPPAPPSSVKRSYGQMTLDDGDDLTDREADFTNDELGAPIEALRGLADAAAARLPAHRAGDDGSVGGTIGGSHRSRVDGKRLRSTANNQDAAGTDRKRGLRASPTASSMRNGLHDNQHDPLDSDLVTSGALTHQDALKLWNIFMQGCPKFIGVFSPQASLTATRQNQMSPRPGNFATAARRTSSPSDNTVDSFEATRSASPFLFATILSVGAKVGLAKDTSAQIAQTCLERSQLHAQETLFRPATLLTKEDVMALNLLASYCDSGWVLCGHAVRIAQELRLDRDFSKLQTLVGADASLLAATTPVKRKSTAEEESLCELARGARLWFFSFLLEHQISYGAGKPAMLHRALVKDCRDFLKLRQPLTTAIDARFVSTLELMVLREQHRDCLSPFDGHIEQAMYRRVASLNEDLHQWLEYWAREFRSRGHTDENFFMGSLRLQCATAKLYLTCTVLRKTGQEQADWSEINQWQRSIVTQAVKAADQTLRIAVENKEYFDLLMWAPHYTIVTATFSAVFLLKALQMYPSSQLISTRGLQDIFRNAEKLAKRFMEFPAASKYGAVILQMLWHAFKFIVGVNKRKGLSVIFGNGGDSKKEEAQSDPPAHDRSNIQALDPGSATRGTLSALHDSPSNAMDDGASSRGCHDEEEPHDSSLRDLDAVIASIDWENVNQCDFRQILYDIDQRQNGGTADAQQGATHGQLSSLDTAVPGRPTDSLNPAVDTATKESNGNTGSATRQVQPDVGAGDAPHKLDLSLLVPFHVPAWVQPHSFGGAEVPTDWHSKAMRTPMLPRHGEPYDASANAYHATNAAIVSNAQQGNFGNASRHPQRHMSAVDAQGPSASTLSAAFAPAAVTPSHLQSFDQIAHELDLGDTLAELFAPSGDVTPLEAETSMRSKSFSQMQREQRHSNQIAAPQRAVH